MAKLSKFKATPNTASVSNITGGSTSEYTPVRVVDIITNTSNLDDYLKISFSDPTNTRNNIKGYATPLDVRNMTVPIPGEIVLLKSSLQGDQTEGRRNPGSLYTSISLWNHPHHSAYFFHESEHNSSFKEQATINPLKSYIGSTIIQGRLAQSIHFSSVAEDTPWKGNQGTPIVVISNGQIETEEGSTPIAEDINQDFSSIYLTAPFQYLDITLADHIKFTSNPEEPKFQQEFTDSQVILNGDRLHFNSKKESILLTSSKYVSAAGEYINLEASKHINLHAEKIYLHNDSKNESQPAALGQEVVNELVKMYGYLGDIAEQLGVAGIALTALGVPNGGQLSKAGIALKAYLETSKNTLGKRILSNKVYLPTKN